MADKQTFKTVLEKHPTMNATGIKIPFDVQKEFGSKRVAVVASIKGAMYRGSIVVMGGEYMLGIPTVFRDAAGISAGDEIVVTVEKDTAERTVEPPDDLKSELKRHALTEKWDRLSYTNRKEHVRAIDEAKQPETRTRRIAKAIDFVRNA